LDLAPPQHLPITAIWCVFDLQCISLEVATTPEEQRLGLMQRKALPPMRGMWFPFDRPREMRFWMFKTIAPLDMVFVSEGRVIAIESKVPICPALPCPSYGPKKLGDGVMELRAGEAQRLNIRVGDPVMINTF
tara:strand:+ start:190 stop:588 length:399 start_codon:yes stop_codon:yes gene_type:complete